jgi:hypothetical protein
VVFTKRLREGVRRGDITCSIRIWQRPRVAAGRRYRMEEGEIEVDSILPIRLSDVTPELARESGFKGVVDLLKVAKHGPGENVYLVRFHYVPAPTARPKTKAPARLARRAARLVLVAAACGAVVSCGHDDEACIHPPSPLPTAIHLRVISATGGAVPGASAEVAGPLSGTVSCTVEATLSSCFVPGYRGTYSMRIVAPGFQTREITVAVSGSDGEPCGLHSGAGRRPRTDVAGPWR